MLLTGERFDRLRGSGAARAFLDGAGPAAVGAILGAVVLLVRPLEEPWQFAVLAAAALVLLLGRAALWALAGAALAGLAAALAGLAAAHLARSTGPLASTGWPRCSRRPPTSWRG